MQNILVNNMSVSEIVTGQFVRISQTPAGVGDRIVARAIDMVVIVLYVVSMVYLLAGWMSGMNDVEAVLTVLVVFLPAVFYSFILETFNHGRTVGKMLMKTRVVKADGSTPGVGDYLLRWVLLLVDLHLGSIGLLAIIFTRYNRRFGDIAAGTLVIKVQDYKRLHISLDEFGYARRDYRPVYPEAARLSLRQADVISKTLYGSENYNEVQAARLSAKIQELFSITRRESDDTAFLVTLLHDYQYYALELV